MQRERIFGSEEPFLFFRFHAGIWDVPIMRRKFCLISGKGEEVTLAVSVLST